MAARRVEPVTLRRAADGDRRVLVGVRIAHVFDVSQTDGDPLPQPDPAWRPTLLTGQAPDGLWDGLALQVAEAGYELSLQYPAGGANGLTMYGPRQVLVRPDVDEAQRVKTLAHELGHVMLHAPVDPENRNVERRCRGQQEVEAESVAFLVASAHGMDTGQYSFAYVAGWAHDAATDNGGDVETTLRLSASRALTTAHRVLDRLNRDVSSSTVIDAEDTIPAHLRTPAPAVRLAPSAEATNTAPHRRPPAVGVGAVTAAAAGDAGSGRPTGRTETELRLHARYERHRYQRIRDGTWAAPFTSTAPVREHLEFLRESGMTQGEISRQSGVSATAMYRATRRPRMTTAAADALLAVQPQPKDETQQATAALRSLVADGWTLHQLADATGLNVRTMGATVNGHTTPNPGSATAILDAYERLRLEDPGDTGAAVWARKRAARAGWDPTIPPPPAVDVDEVAVDRVVNGDVAPLRPAERRAALQRLAGHYSDEEIARRLGVHKRTVIRHRERNHLPAYSTQQPLASRTRVER